MYRSGIVRIDLNTGASTSLPTMANTDQAPHSVFGNLLLVDTQTNKGTTKYGLTGLRPDVEHQALGGAASEGVTAAFGIGQRRSVPRVASVGAPVGGGTTSPS